MAPESTKLIKTGVGMLFARRVHAHAGMCGVDGKGAVFCGSTELGKVGLPTKI